MIHISPLNYFSENLISCLINIFQKRKLLKNSKIFYQNHGYKGILKSIKVKNKTYRQFFKSTDSLKKNELHIKFKTYRNSVVNLTHQCKEDYFKSYFENNKKKLKRNMEQHQKPYKHKKILKKHNKLP